MVERKSSGPLRPWRRFRARRTASLRVSGWMARRSDASSSRVACMKSMSSGSGLRNDRASASVPRSATSRRRISSSISLRRLSSAGLVLVAGQALLERRQCPRVRPGGRPPSAAPGHRRGRGSAASGTGSRCRPPAGPAPSRRTGSPPGGPARRSGPRWRSSGPGRASRPAPRGSAPPRPRHPGAAPGRRPAASRRSRSGRSASPPSSASMSYCGPRREK